MTVRDTMMARNMDSVTDMMTNTITYTMMVTDMHRMTTNLLMVID